MKEIYFVRHAVPENDAVSFRFSGFLQDMLGHQDHPLAERGREQARAAAPGLASAGVERLVASTMKRAGETARIIADETGIPLDREHFFDDLIEIAPGTRTLWLDRFFRFLVAPERPRWFRRTAASLIGPALGLYYFISWYRGRTSSGDSVAATRERLERMFAFLSDRPERRIAVVCHSLLILFVIREITGGWWRTLRGLETPVNNCSVTRVDLAADGVTRRPVFLARMVAAPEPADTSGARNR